MHSNSVPAGDRDDGETRTMYVVKWSSYVVAVYADCGYIRMDMDFNGHKYTQLISAEDVERITVSASFLLPGVLRELNDALVKARKDAQRG